MSAPLGRLRDGVATAEEQEAAAAEIERLRAILAEVRADINNYGFSDAWADETHYTLSKIDAALEQDAPK